MERDGHHTVCRVECLFHSITMVNININVQYTGIDSIGNPLLLQPYLSNSRMPRTISFT